jgi:hypothetical protein
VEKQMPPKHEHVLTCNLSRRQRQLYDEYMARSEIRSVMTGGNFMGVINVLMQLRKVGACHCFLWLGQQPAAPPMFRSGLLLMLSVSRSHPTGKATKLVALQRTSAGAHQTRAAIYTLWCFLAAAAAAVVCCVVYQVCNHPDLFEGRPIVSAFDMPGLSLQYPSCVMSGTHMLMCLFIWGGEFRYCVVAED